MENVYRREAVRSQNAARVFGEKKKSRIKKFFIKQTLVCIALLFFCVFIKFVPEYDFAHKTIKFILTQNTNYKEIPNKIKTFSKEYIFDKTAENTPDKKALRDMFVPLVGDVTSKFGIRESQTGEETFHYGIDIAKNTGEHIFCAQDGVAKEVSETAEYGKYIVVEHEDNIKTLYAHCSTVVAAEGDEIKKGQLIAEVGETGNATGPHLHFEIMDGENWIDPEEIINFSKE